MSDRSNIGEKFVAEVHCKYQRCDYQDGRGRCSSRKTRGVSTGYGFGFYCEGHATEAGMGYYDAQIEKEATDA